jgi:hypothetical protein
VASDRSELEARVRARWERIDWTSPLPPDSPGMPEGHYMGLDPLGLDPARRVALGRLFACFTCELFVHFEAYVIRYLERFGDRVPALPPAAIERFVAEERVHSEMFHRLLTKLRPDLYSGRRLRFLRWSPADDAALALAPVGTFFLLAWLFEEITLFVPRVMEESPAECAPLALDVMRLHAKEEQPHVAMDACVMEHLCARPRWLGRLEAGLALSLLVYVDGKAQRGWRRLVDRATIELGLDARQQALVEQRGPSRSDRFGMESFASKIDERGLPGGTLLGWALRREIA